MVSAYIIFDNYSVFEKPHSGAEINIMQSFPTLEKLKGFLYVWDK